MIEEAVAENLNLNIGNTFMIIYIKNYGDIINETNSNLTVIGIFETGGNEDSQIFVNLQVTQNLTGRTGKIHTIQVST